MTRRPSVRIAGLVALLILGGVAGAAAGGDRFFSPYRHIQGFDASYGLMALDLNHDGAPDLVGVAGSSEVSVMLGDGAGGFSTPRRYPGDATPENSTITTDAHGLAAADLDRDGHLDLVLTNGLRLFVLDGDGRGGFSRPKAFLMGSQPRSVVVDDVNGDGWPDLMVQDLYSGVVTVRQAQDRRPGPATSWRVGDSIVGIGWLDLDDDGHPDALFKPNWSGPLNVSWNRGGRFEPVIEVMPGEQGDIDQPLAGDFDGDGRIDLIDVRRDSPAASMLHLEFRPGLGAGQFDAPRVIEDSAWFDNLIAVDWDQDGRSDLLEAGDGRVWFRRGLGNGSWEPRVPVALLPALGPPVAIDLGGDGPLELLAPIREGIGLVPGDSRLPGLPPLYPTSGRYNSVTARDFNGDGRPDLVIRSSDYTPVDTTVITLRLNEGAGRFGPPSPVGGKRGSSIVLAGDFEGDGRSDLLTALGEVSPGYLYFRGDGQGGFLSMGPPLFPDGFRPIRVLPDLNGDGASELLGLGPGGGQDIMIVGGGADGWTPLDRWTMEPGFNMAAGDVTGDGRTDLVMSVGPGQLQVMQGRGDGSFDPMAPQSLSLLPNRIALGHLDDDGVLDLIVASYSELATCLNDGSGHFTIGEIQERPCLGLETADLNGDDYADVVVSLDQPTILTFLGQGDGRLGAPSAVGVLGDASGTLPADLDGDDRADLVVPGGYSGQVAVLLNQGPDAPRITSRAVRTDGWSVIARFTVDALPEAGEYSLERLGPDGRWARAGDGVRSGEVIVELVDDTATLPGPADYRLRFATDDGTSLVLDRFEALVAPPPAPDRVLGVSPNPADGAVAIYYEVTARGHEPIRIFDLSGRPVRRLLDRPPAPGRGTIVWNGEDDAGRSVRPGVYFLRWPGAVGEFKILRIR